MAIGLAGGIASGKTRFERKFHELGYPVFNADIVESTIRSGTTKKDKEDDIFKYDSIVSLANELSPFMHSSLESAFPGIYDKAGVFQRDALLHYLKDESHGIKNHQTYSEIMWQASRTAYTAWRTLAGDRHVLSSGMFIESGNLDFVKELYLVKIPLEEQIKHLIAREHGKET